MATFHIEIPDHVLGADGLTENQIRLELACGLFAQQKLGLWPAAQLAGLSRGEMEDELADRNIPIYTIDEAYWVQEQSALRTMEELWPSSSATPRQ